MKTIRCGTGEKSEDETIADCIKTFLESEKFISQSNFIMKKTIIFSFQAAVLLFVVSFAPSIVRAQAEKLNIPAEIKIFIESGETAIALESADLNADGTKDFILVTEKTTATNNSDEADSERTLMILTRDAQGKLKSVKSNNDVVYCKSCGGAFGDPFADLDAKRNSFRVYNYGGSAWRWSETYQFDYSRIDKTWQLVRVESESYNSLDPNKVKVVIRTPKNFGKIDIADFDLEILNKPARKK